MICGWRDVFPAAARIFLQALEPVRRGSGRWRSSGHLIAVRELALDTMSHRLTVASLESPHPPLVIWFWPLGSRSLARPSTASRLCWFPNRAQTEAPLRPARCSEKVYVLITRRFGRFGHFLRKVPLPAERLIHRSFVDMPCAVFLLLAIVRNAWQGAALAAAP